MMYLKQIKGRILGFIFKAENKTEKYIFLDKTKKYK